MEPRARGTSRNLLSPWPGPLPSGGFQRLRAAPGIVIVFSLPFLIDLGLIFRPKLPPEIHQNPSKSLKKRCQDAFPC